MFAAGAGDLAVDFLHIDGALMAVHGFRRGELHGFGPTAAGASSSCDCLRALSLARVRAHASFLVVGAQVRASESNCRLLVAISKRSAGKACWQKSV